MAQPSSPLPIRTAPASYDTPVTARAEYDSIMSHAFSLPSHSHSTEAFAQPHPDLNALRQWKQAVLASNFHPSAQATSPAASYLLTLYYHTAVIILSTLHTPNEAIFDTLTPHFSATVNAARNLLQTWSASPKTKTQHYSLLYSFDLGITPPMFLTASRCRDPAIRRLAVDLMLQASDYHGAWQDRYTGLCARRLIELEEGRDYESPLPAGLRHVVPECQRVRKISADLDEGGAEIVLRYVRFPFAPGSPVLSTRIVL
ncbi:hypothetical protein MBLNU230_g2647t1 [Neophaeotheca triangularis]